MTRIPILWTLAVWALILCGTRAAPLSARQDQTDAPSPLSEAEMQQLRIPATFAADAYCTGLQANSSVGQDGVVLWKMGDGDHLQMVYVAYSPTLGIVVAHQGTNRSSAASLENDLRINRVERNERLTSLPLDTQVADGFQDSWLDTADEVLEQIVRARQRYPDAKLTFTGHSLGAAISLFDALYVGQSLNVSVNAVLFGLPRVGDKSFADAVDTLLDDQRHVTNAYDPIPHLPFRAWGFQQPSGEVWITPRSTTDNVEAVSCPGQENPDCADSVKLNQFTLKDHSGPYFGVTMGCSQGNVSS